MGRESYSPKPTDSRPSHPFRSAEEAWFWFMLAQQARADGARIVAGAALARPCEPMDILKIVDRLYRQRVLMLDHLLVLRHYGRRMMPPDGRRVREVRAATLWQEALAHLESCLVEKGIVTARRWWRDLDPQAGLFDPSCPALPTVEACHVGTP